MPLSPEARAEWRARREQRRAKERELNLVRAAKMHAARLEYEREHSPQSATPSRSTFVGCAGWYYWHWRHCFYPPDIPGSRWFDYYASQFRTVELNAPFYRWPSVATVQTWLRQLGRRRLIYTVKVNELITHIRRFEDTTTLVKDFGLIADVLGDRFGCFLFQLPPSFSYTPTALRRIVKQLDPRHRNVVEFRHRSWWNQTVYRALRDHNIIFCSVSGPRLPDELIRTADDIYLRFHGTTRWYRHDYTRAELQTWVNRIQESGAKHVWAYFNNDRECYAIKNARTLIALLKRGCRTFAPD